MYSNSISSKLHCGDLFHKSPQENLPEGGPEVMFPGGAYLMWRVSGHGVLREPGHFQSSHGCLPGSEPGSLMRFTGSSVDKLIIGADVHIHFCYMGKSFSRYLNNNRQVLLHCIFVEVLNQLIINYLPRATPLPMRVVEIYQEDSYPSGTCKQSQPGQKFTVKCVNLFGSLKLGDQSSLRSKGFYNGGKRSPGINTAYFPRVSILLKNRGKS